MSNKPRTKAGKLLDSALEDAYPATQAILAIEAEAYENGLLAAFEDVQRIDRAEAERSAGAASLDVERLTEALRHLVVRSRSTHEFAESLAAAYARLAEGTVR